MSVTINTKILRTRPVINEDGLILVVLKNAIPNNSDFSLKRLYSLDDLYKHFPRTKGTQSNQTDIPLEEARELYTVEYLIRGGANVAVLPIKEDLGDAGTEITDEMVNKALVEEMDFKIVIVPYAFAEEAADLAQYNLITDKLSANVLIDVKPELNVGTELGSLLTNFSNPRISLFINAGYVSFTSYYASIPADFEEGFYGIPASVAVALRESRNLVNGVSWKPVAGENETGIFPEFTKVYRKFTTPEKNTFQAGRVNPMVLKRGVGVMMASQNTTAKPAEGVDYDTNPFMRRHAVTQALEIKRRVKTIAERFVFQPNVPSTWTHFKLALDSYLQSVSQAGGIEEYLTIVGGAITTPEQIAQGILNAYIEVKIVSLAEHIVMNVAIREVSGEIDINMTVEGVDL